jgi:hypothetical protein
MGSPDGALQNYPIKFIVHTGYGTDYGQDVYLNAHSESWPNDLRFTDNSNNPLSYWVESYDSNSAIVWVKINNIPISPGQTTVKLYYGKSGDSSESNGATTFSFFDDFNAASVDTAKWTVSTMGGGSVTGSGALIALSANPNQNARLTSTMSFTSPIVIGTKFEPVISNSLGVRDRLSSSNVLQAPFSFDTGIFNAEMRSSLQMYWNGTSSPLFSLNTFYKSEEAFIPGTSVKWTIYDTNQATLYSNSAPTSKTNYRPEYAVGDFPQPDNWDYGYMDLDWMYVRNYTPHEPTQGAWSAENAVQQSGSSGITLIEMIIIVLVLLVIIMLLVAVFIFIGYMIGKRK